MRASICRASDSSELSVCPSTPPGTLSRKYFSVNLGSLWERTEFSSPVAKGGSVGSERQRKPRGGPWEMSPRGPPAPGTSHGLAPPRTALEILGLGEVLVAPQASARGRVTARGQTQRHPPSNIRHCSQYKKRTTLHFSPVSSRCSSRLLATRAGRV